MTTIMHKTYGYTLGGVKRYAVNRFLRLYPTCWIVVTLTIFLIWVTGSEYSSQFKDALSIPTSLSESIFNFTMIFPAWTPWEISPRLSPPTWALTIEIAFYLVIGLGISKSTKLTWIWFGLSVMYYLLTYYLELSNSARYSNFLAASLPFSIGALLYFYKDVISNTLVTLRINDPVIAMTMYSLNGIFAVYIQMNSFEYHSESKQVFLELSKYLNMVLASHVVITLLYNGEKYFSRKVDRFVGDLSYPIYLMHWQCALLTSFIIFDVPTRGLNFSGFLVLSVSLVITIAISFLINSLIGQTFSSLRDRVKNQ